MRRSRQRPRALRRQTVILLVLAPVLALLCLTHPVRVALLTLAVLPSAIGSLPVDPLVHLTPAPKREGFELDYAAGHVDGDIYSPGSIGRHGVLILVLGARPVERDDPVLVRFAEGLSRAGLVVMIPVSSNLSAGRVVAEEVDAIVGEVDLLRQRSDVDQARIGILGFSVGGSVAIVAAADPRLDGRLALVNAFGSYDDATDLVRAASTRSLAYAGLDEAWEPNPLTLWVIARQFVDTLTDPHDRDLLDRLYLQSDQTARDETSSLTTEGSAALGLLDGLSPAETEAALARLPPASLARLQAIRPAAVLDRLHTPLFIMHDRGDHFVPYTESRRMAADTPAAVLARFAEFDLFDHVMPNRLPSDPGFYVELGRLLRHLYAILLYVL